MENYYRTLLYSLPEIVYQVNPEGKFIYVNDSIRQLGYAPEDLLGKHFSAIIAGEDHALLDRDMFMKDKNSSDTITPSPLFFNERRTGGRITRNLKVRLLCGNTSHGEESFFIDGEVFATGIYEIKKHGSKYAGTIGVIRELSGDIEREKTIMRIERFYRLLIDNSLDVVTILAHDGTVLYMSKSIERSLGFPPMNYIGENISDMTHPDDHEIITSAFSGENIPPDSSIKIDFRYKHSDLSWRFFESSFIRIMDDEKRHVMCYILHSIDITRRRKAEISLANRERVYRQLLRVSPDAIALFDSDGDVIMANDKATEIAGIQRGDLIGKNFLSLIRHEDRKGALRIREAIDREGILRDFQFMHLRQDGGEIPIEISISGIVNDSGVQEGYITVFRDITERKQAEEERQRLKAELEEERNILKERNSVIENDLNMARTILMNLIPSECFFQEIAFYFEPMDIIGGDFYDFIRFDDGNKIGIFICDVSGHGLPSAFITSMIKTTVDQAGEVLENPAMLLCILNDMLIPVSSSNFVTALYAIYDRVSRTMTYSRAGHNNPYRIKGNSVTMIKSANKCIPLGIFDNADLKEKAREYKNELLTFTPGEKVLFYTDGLTETRKMRRRLSGSVVAVDAMENMDFESSGLIEAIKENAHLEPKLFIENIVTLLNIFRGTDSLEDDLCLICLEIH